MAVKIPIVARGQAFVPRADEWNTIARAVNEYNSKKQRQQHSTGLPPGVILARNDSSDTISRFGVVGIDNALIQPHNSFERFASSIACIVSKPSSDHVGGPFGIAQEPIGVGKIGVVMVRGETPVIVNVLDEAHRFADIDPDNADNLISAESGPVMLLTVQGVDDRENAGYAWCYCSLAVTLMLGN